MFWPLLYLCRPLCIFFERCLDLNPESCRSKQARYQLSQPSSPLSNPSTLLSHPSPPLLFSIYKAFVDTVNIICIKSRKNIKKRTLKKLKGFGPTFFHYTININDKTYRQSDEDCNKYGADGIGNHPAEQVHQNSCQRRANINSTVEG